jgi:hypothetical protein
MDRNNNINVQMLENKDLGYFRDLALEPRILPELPAFSIPNYDCYYDKRLFV